MSNSSDGSLTFGRDHDQYHDEVGEYNDIANDAQISDGKLQLHEDMKYLIDPPSPELPTTAAPDKRTVTEGIEIIDLTGPDDDIQTTKSTAASNRSHVLAPTIDHAEFNSHEGIESIGTKSAKYWAKQKDRWRLTVAILWEMLYMQRQGILDLMQHGDTEVWRLTGAVCLEASRNERSNGSSANTRLANTVCRLYLSFLTCRSTKRSDGLSKRDADRLKKNYTRLFSKFCRLIRAITPYFPGREQIANVSSIENGQDVDDEMPEANQSSSTGRYRKPKEVIQNRQALNMRKADQERDMLSSMRAQAFWENIDVAGIDRARFVINDTKEENQGLIYCENRICALIKDHQIKGVRFLWNQIVAGAVAGHHQGCLLAHTMGLGKTMQTITFLIALVQAGKSTDPTVQEQIPVGLRESKTLVLCPTSLVLNWVEEMHRWGRDLLGPVHKIEASDHARVDIFMRWNNHGGVLVMGYEMTKRFYEGADDDMKRLFLKSANVVVADEAHYLKNQETQISLLCAKFRTRSRIALTGSPLANNIEEYFSMIDWVAPGYLGPLQEFKQLYAIPIQNGVWGDSNDCQKRQALTLLEALQKTVGPKVNRATIHGSLKHELPEKMEFVLSIRATPLQKRLYKLFIEGMDKMYTSSHHRNAGILSLLSRLVLICNHPCIFRGYVKSIEYDEENAKTFPKEIIDKVLEFTSFASADDVKYSNKMAILTAILDESRTAGDKVLVFSQSIPTLDYLQSVLELQGRSFCRLDGKTKVKIRQDTVKSFNTGAEEVFLISTTAGGYGLNIQGANRVVIFDFKFNPVHDQQAVGRAYRIGQKKPVFVYHFVTAGSFEDDLHAKSVFKLQLSARVVDNANPISWSEQRKKWLHDIQEPTSKDLSPFQGKDGVLDAIIAKFSNREISSMLSTDVFEEEDITSGLTEEEQHEAQRMSEAIMSRNKDIKTAAGGNTQNATSLSDTQAGNEASQLDTLTDYDPSKPRWLTYFPGQSELFEKAADGSLVPKPPPKPSVLVDQPSKAIQPEQTSTTQPVSSERVDEPKPIPLALPTKARFEPKQSAYEHTFISRLESSIVLASSETESAMKKLASDIKTALKAKRRGFLYDDDRWKFLSTMAEKAQFRKAVLKKQILPAQLATADESEIQRLAETSQSTENEN